MNRIQRFGKEGEEIVAQFLTKKGFSIEQRNYRISNGEIDIIALKHPWRVFVEVKRRRVAYGDCTELISEKKQRKIIQAALHYQSVCNRYCERGVRFDVALLIGQKMKLMYIENAFGCNEHTW